MNDITLNPYLNFNGNTRQAMQFYQSVLGGDLDIQTFGDTGMDKPGVDKDTVIHARLEASGIVLMASDTADHGTAVFGTSVHLSLMGNDLDHLTGIFNKLGEGGTTDMPLAKQFWGDIYGQVTDQFGIHWMVNITGAKVAGS